MSKPTDKEKLKNHKHFWELVNLLTDICYSAIGEKELYPDDIMGALEIVKMDVWKEHIMIIMEDKFKDEKFLNEISKEYKERKMVRSGNNAG